MGIQNELDSVASFLTSLYPSATIKFAIPKEPKADTFVVRAGVTDISTETRFHMRIERDYQIVYYGVDVGATLERMDHLSRQAMDGRLVIPMLDGSMRYIRVDSFSFSHPTEAEGGLFAAIGVMPTELRQARTQEVFEKIQQISARFE